MTQKELSDDRLELAYKIMAGIIRDYGEKYLPIFKRLHEELMTRKVNKDFYALAISVA